MFNVATVFRFYVVVACPRLGRSSLFEFCLKKVLIGENTSSFEEYCAARGFYVRKPSTSKIMIEQTSHLIVGDGIKQKTKVTHFPLTMTEENDSPTGEVDEEVKSRKRKERLEQNRISARESRKRKKSMIEELQRTVITLSRENKDLNERNEALRRQLMEIGAKVSLCCCDCERIGSASSKDVMDTSADTSQNAIAKTHRTLFRSQYFLLFAFISSSIPTLCLCKPSCQPSLRQWLLQVKLLLLLLHRAMPIMQAFRLACFSYRELTWIKLSWPHKCNKLNNSSKPRLLFHQLARRTKSKYTVLYLGVQDVWGDCF